MTPDDPTQWVPAAYCTADYMAEWGKDPHVSASSYEFDIQFQSTTANEELGIVVTEESGSWTDSSGKIMTTWQGSRLIYFAAPLRSSGDSWACIGGTQETRR